MVNLGNGQPSHQQINDFFSNFEHPDMAISNTLQLTTVPVLALFCCHGDFIINKKVGHRLNSFFTGINK